VCSGGTGSNCADAFSSANNKIVVLRDLLSFFQILRQSKLEPDSCMACRAASTFHSHLEWKHIMVGAFHWSDILAWIFRSMSAGFQDFELGAGKQQL
jgi:hypothetical protein